MTGAAPDWIEILPVGEIRARDGRRWTLDDPAMVIANTLLYRNGLDLVIDYEHQTEAAERNGQPAPAAGWIKELEVRDGAIWGRVEWTERAAEAIRAKEYRYFSPVFAHERKTGRVTMIDSGALTNNPALDLTALAHFEIPATARASAARISAQERDIIHRLNISESAYVAARDADRARRAECGY